MEQEFRQQSVVPPVADTGLYSFSNEHDACGVGLVADLNNVPSHRIVEMGLTVLKRLMHRGASGGDPETGDGAGLLLALPDGFFRRELGERLPEKGRYGVAMIFGGVGQEAAIEEIVRGEGVGVICWREVPTHPEKIGAKARESCPAIPLCTDVAKAVGERSSPPASDRSWATEASRSPQREEKTQASSSVWAFVSFRKASSEKSASAAAFPRGERRRRSPAGTAFAPGTASACGSQEKSAVTGTETPGRKRAASRIWAQKGMSRHLGMKTGPRGRIELESIAAKRFA